MRQLIERRLSATRPPADPTGAALARLPGAVAASWFPRPLVPAAVLVPLVDRPAGLSMLLTLRTDHLDDHPGQISFPGGRSEPDDVSPRQTALREAGEEIGLRPASIDVAGYLDPLAVITGYAVTPVVGFVAADTALRVDAFEVAEAFEVPLDFFLDEANVRHVRRTVRGQTLPFVEYHYQARRIWGATASMIRDLTEIIKENNN